MSAADPQFLLDSIDLHWRPTVQQLRAEVDELRAEVQRLRVIEAAAVAYVRSDPPRPEWRGLCEALGVEWRPPEIVKLIEDNDERYGRSPLR